MILIIISIYYFSSSIRYHNQVVTEIKIPLVKSPRQGTKLSSRSCSLQLFQVIDLFHSDADALMFYKPEYYLHAS